VTTARKRDGEVIKVALAREDLDMLLAIAHYYEKSMGPMRHVVGITTAPDMRKRLRFIREESVWLERFAESAREGMSARERIRGEVIFTPRAAVAFWGRLLASLESKRSRRKLSDEEAILRRALADKLRDGLRAIRAKRAESVDQEILTRRNVEQEWMRRQLAQQSTEEAE
jgi:hypothetical protein